MFTHCEMVSPYFPVHMLQKWKLPLEIKLPFLRLKTATKSWHIWGCHSKGLIFNIYVIKEEQEVSEPFYRFALVWYTSSAKNYTLQVRRHHTELRLLSLSEPTFFYIFKQPFWLTWGRHRWFHSGRVFKLLPSSNIPSTCSFYNKPLSICVIVS